MTSPTEDQVVTINYQTIDSPIGALFIAMSQDGLLRLAFAGEGSDWAIEEVGAIPGAELSDDSEAVSVVVEQLNEYFRGERRTFDLPIDYRLSGGFRKQALKQLEAIDYGTTKSYAEVAAAAGSPQAVRAVGSACATNPIAVVIPCHRVVRSDGSIGQYGGGVATKEWLLNLESGAA